MTTKKRDVWIGNFCNWLINNIASREYRAFVWATYTTGRDQLWLDAKNEAGIFANNQDA
jgi:hypothetical protein